MGDIALALIIIGLFVFAIFGIATNHECDGERDDL